MTTPREDAIAAITVEHRPCGPKYDGCYSHVPMPHCRACGMALPCDVMRLAVLGAEAETPDFDSCERPDCRTPKAHAAHGEAETPDDEWAPVIVNKVETRHYVDLASPETAEALARADFEEHELHRHGDKWADLPEDRYKQWWRDHAQSVLAAMRETGR